MNNIPRLGYLGGNFFNRYHNINNFRVTEESYYKNGQFNRFNLNDIDKIHLNRYPKEDPDFLLSILENFDLKKLDKMEYPHPFNYLINTINLDIEDYFGEDLDEFDNPIDNNNYENKSIDVLGDDYFKILDNYYRYGIVFNSKNVQQRNKLLVKYCNLGYYKVSELKYINYYPKGLEIINLDEIDNGEIELSEIEKWKRKIIIEKKSLLKKNH